MVAQLISFLLGWVLSFSSKWKMGPKNSILVWRFSLKIILSLVIVPDGQNENHSTHDRGYT